MIKLYQNIFWGTIEELKKYTNCYRYYTDDEIYVVFKGLSFVKDNTKEFQFIFIRNIYGIYGHMQLFIN